MFEPATEAMNHHTIVLGLLQHEDATFEPSAPSCCVFLCDCKL